MQRSFRRVPACCFLPVRSENRLDGELPAAVHDQLEAAFANITGLLAAHGLTADDLVKVNIWLTEPIDRERYPAIQGAFLGDARPSATLGYVSALAHVSIKVEIEAIAAILPA